MRYLISGVIIFLSFIVGTFGFAQVIGTLKYFKNSKLGSAMFTIVLWLIILCAGAFVVLKFLNNYAVALYIGYGVSFVLSLGTKPD